MNLAPTDALIQAVKTLNWAENKRMREESNIRSFIFQITGKDRMKDLTQEDRDIMNTLFGETLILDRGLDQSQISRWKSIEKRQTKIIEKEVKDSPFGDFVGSENGRSGLGKKSFGRLWATIGDPLYDSHNGRNRTRSMLFGYCGVGDPNDKRREGNKIHFSPKAKKQLVGVIAVKAGIMGNPAPYLRWYYDEIKELAQEKFHTTPCSQCGTKSAEKKAEQAMYDEALGTGVRRVKNDVPASVGDPWKPGHIDGHARRKVARKILMDLYNFSLGIS